MQFITNGPDIPETLLQAHEEGRVAFFCGAGISYPAGLPGFKGLVDEIYRRTGTSKQPIEHEAYARGQFDATLDLLERRIPGQRIAVRTALAQALQPKLRRKGATDTHAALLQLARSREGSLRLVTTNFDRVFEQVAKRTKLPFKAHPAPMLPVPKNSRWNGLVYLHGLLPDEDDEGALNRLVLTSGDFGLAYLTERWAARFVSELFRNYVVCFVGYSINDPVLRYMMDALAADRMQGEVTPQAYALGECEPGQETHKTIEWKAKGVTPILYEVPRGSFDHSALHNTLKAWAETYRDGILGKERIVVEHALARPSASTRQDDFVGRMVWALSHESGLPAKRFADHNPVPPLEWLDAFSEARYGYEDLSRFGIQPHTGSDRKLRFSLVHRPAPYNYAAPMALASRGLRNSEWDDVMPHLARWLVRHLDDPVLIFWVAQRGGHLHERWIWMIENELDRFARLENSAATAELNEIRLHAPSAVPRPMMRTIWRLLLTGRVKSPGLDVDLYRWKDRLKRDGLSTALRLELRDLLAPKVTLKRPFRWSEEELDAVSEPPKSLRQLVDWELELTASSVRGTLSDIADTKWQEVLPELLEDFQQLLRDALDLLCELGEASDQSDRSHWDLPSISAHWQNRGFRDWATLIELLRDAWLAVKLTDLARSSRIALGWFELPYATFKRLALFAASQEGCIGGEQWVSWLLAADAWWLWSVDTKRETMRLLVLQGGSLEAAAQTRLEEAILAGPPREMYREGLEDDRWQELVEHSVWLHLAKLSVSGATLGSLASQQLASLSSKHPLWKLAPNESDEFSHWMSGTGDPDYEDSRRIDIAPRKRNDLVTWLKQPVTERSPLHEDTWQEVCRTRFFHSLCALHDLAKEEFWPVNRWRDALHVWSEQGLVARSWRFGAPLVAEMPDDVFREIVRSVTSWVEAASKSVKAHEAIMLEMCRRALAMPIESSTGILRNGEPINQPVTEAINHPVGHITQALLNLWFKRSPNDNEGLPTDIEPFFTELCDRRVAQFRHGRVLLAATLIALFRVDRSWTEVHLLPLLDWQADSAEAKATWEGFLWSPRLYRQLLLAFKPQFLATPQHYVELGEHSRQFATFLTYAALEPIDGYSTEDYRSAFEALPREGLREAAQALSQALEGAGDQREDYWRNRVHPFWQNIWPKSLDLASPGIAEPLVRLCLAAGREFPSAFQVIGDWLQPIEHPYYVVHRLLESGLCAEFPDGALRLLDAIIQDQLWMPSAELGQCLDEIARAMPSLEQDPKYRRLRDYLRRRGV